MNARLHRFQQPFVLAVRTDPKPNDRVIPDDADRTEVVIHPRRPVVPTHVELLELQPGRRFICLPDTPGFLSVFACASRQSGEHVTKCRRCMRSHSSPKPPATVRPASKSVSAVPAIWSSNDWLRGSSNNASQRSSLSSSWMIMEATKSCAFSGRLVTRVSALSKSAVMPKLLSDWRRKQPLAPNPP